MVIVVKTNSFGRRILRLGFAGAAALSILVAPAAMGWQSVAQSEAAPCYPGFTPGNPYIPSCNVGPRTPRVRGGPPDQAAVIACRGFPGCLSWYINHPH